MKATINGIVIEGEPKELAQFVDEWLNLPERKGVEKKVPRTLDEFIRRAQQDKDENKRLRDMQIECNLVLTNSPDFPWLIFS